MRNRRMLTAVIAACLAALGVHSAHAQLFQAPTGAGGTYNVYELATDMSGEGLTGHLA